MNAVFTALALVVTTVATLLLSAYAEGIQMESILEDIQEMGVLHD